MNIAVTIFYSIAGVWLIGLLVFAIVKRAKLKKKQKELEKEIENENKRKEID